MKTKTLNVAGQFLPKPVRQINAGIFLVLIFLCAVFNSCSIKKRVYMPGYYIAWHSFVKGDKNESQKQFVNYSLSAYNALCIKPTQETFMDITESARIVCNEGTVVDIPEYAFEYENGSDIKCTKVCVYVWEYFTLNDILTAGLTTTSNRKMLFSDGMVYVEARCFGERLKLKPGKEIVVKIPSVEPDNKMQLFTGNLKNGIIDWKVNGKMEISNSGSESDLESANYEEEGGIGNSSTGYLMKLSKLGWINCDRFYDIQKKTKLIVKVPSVKNTTVALIFKDIKSIMPGYCYSNNTIEFANLPDGQNVTLLAYSIDEKAKNAKACTYNLLLGETKEIELKMNEMGLDELKSLIASLN